MRTRLFFTTIATALLCSAWNSDQKKDIKKAEWLIGTWENKTPRGSIYESWKKSGTDEFIGKSYIIKEKDTIVFETIRIVQEGDQLFYIPTVKNQNGGMPVRFALKKNSESNLIFENLQHDFPQIISYEKIDGNSLLAEISGSKNGRISKQSFPMKRIN